MRGNHSGLWPWAPVLLGTLPALPIGPVNLPSERLRREPREGEERKRQGPPSPIAISAHLGTRCRALGGASHANESAARLPGTAPGGSPSGAGAAPGQRQLSQGHGGTAGVASSPQPNKQKRRRQPLEEMHVDIYIHRKGGDQSPGTLSEGTSASPSSNSSTSHTQCPLRRLASHPPHGSAMSPPLSALSLESPGPSHTSSAPEDPPPLLDSV